MDVSSSQPYGLRFRKSLLDWVNWINETVAQQDDEKLIRCITDLRHDLDCVLSVRN